MDLPRRPVQRGLARAVRPQVQGSWCQVAQAPRRRTDGDEARERAGLEQCAHGLEENDRAEDVDLGGG
jgi:hypothetical protein